MSLLIKNARLVLRDSIKPGSVLISQGKITALEFEHLSKEAEKELDAQGRYLLPGLIDLHYHGLFILPAPERIEEYLKKIKPALAQKGVLGFLATFPAMEPEKIADSLLALKEAEEKTSSAGARLLGAYLEGPFISPEARGAQPEGGIFEYQPGSGQLEKILSAGKGLIKIITIAPEQKYAKELVAQLRQNQILPALGHSRASYELAEEFCELGANHITHLFNAMSGIHHRQPGLALSGLLNPNFSKEIIVDGYHLHPAVVKLVWKVSPLDKIVLITDFVGDEEQGGEEPPRLEDGRLAGSRLRLLKAVRNFQNFTGASLAEAVSCASLNPAKVLGLEDWGELKEGNRANLILLNDSWQVDKVLIDGELWEG